VFQTPAPRPPRWRDHADRYRRGLSNSACRSRATRKWSPPAAAQSVSPAWAGCVHFAGHSACLRHQHDRRRVGDGNIPLQSLAGTGITGVQRRRRWLQRDHHRQRYANAAGAPG
jgi:hypothetical protein